MGLLELLLGKDNPAAQWANDNGATLGALGAGIASGPTFGRGVANGLSMLPQAKILDQQARDRREERAKEETQRNMTLDILRNTYPDLAQAVEAGAITPTDAWNERFARDRAAKAGPELTANMRDFQFAQDNPGFAEFINPGGSGGGDQPASVKEYQFAQSQGYDKDYQTFIQEKGRNAGTPPATIAKEIFEADEGAQAGQNVITALDQALTLNDTAWDGPLADLGSSTTALLGKKDDPTTLAAVQTQELKNLVTANALESLKATFGAAPTEGERKILLEVQGSINQPRDVRKRIFERAKVAAERRLKFNQERGNALRGGSYFDPGYSPVGGGDGGPADMSDIDAILTEQGL